MSTSDDLINFDEIEPHKENIQRLQGGRSAKALAAIYSPRDVDNALNVIPSDSEKFNDRQRQEFEKELQTIDDSDDPLDIFDRYVRWTLDTYSQPASQQSQLLPLLERATKAFLKSPHYKNDPRYLKLWLHYIRLFTDEPRQTFAFLARNNIADGLALFYEEFAAYLESQDRWTQAEEIYSMGVDKEARPTERLLRKYGEFQQRFESRTQDSGGPSSPALPIVRAALAEKVDPFFASPSAPLDPQARRPDPPTKAKSGKAKMAIFTDTEEPKPPVLGGGGDTRNESMQTMAERKKENKQAATAWSGQTLQGGKRNVGVEKLMIFKDKSQSQDCSETSNFREQQQTVNPRTGRVERVFVHLEAVYPDSEDFRSQEYCFEELRAKHRGWLDRDWGAENQEARLKKQREVNEMGQERKPLKPKDNSQSHNPAAPATLLAKGLKQIALNDVNDENAPPSQEDIQRAKMLKKQRKEERANRTRKIKVMEVRGETQTIQTNLLSPTGPKIRKKKNAEPTMTFHTKEAMNEIYDIFNQPLKTEAESVDEAESSDDSDDDDAYTSAGESTCTGRISGPDSEYGDETGGVEYTEHTVAKSEIADDETDAKSVSDWSDFTESKHVPSKEGNQNGDDDEEMESTATRSPSTHEEHGQEDLQDVTEEGLLTPTSPEPPRPLPTRYVPVPPEDCEVPTRPYRDQVQMANNRLPFMTPIVEKTENSLGAATVLAEKDYFSSKTPSRQNGRKTPTIIEDEDDDAEPLSSPFGDILSHVLDENAKVPQPALPKPDPAKTGKPLGISKSTASISGPDDARILLPKGPLVNDKQCNPVDESVRQVILENIHPPLASYDGYSANPDQNMGRSAEIRKYTRAVQKFGKNSSDLPPAPNLRFQSGEREYTVKRELGKGAFAPVYLVESEPVAEEDEQDARAQMGRGAFTMVPRARVEAMKMEEPPSAWEFYMVRQTHRRLGISRAAESVIHAYEMRMFKDECYLIEQYRDQGTLLDLVNVARAEVTAGGSGVMDEVLAMWFSIELLRTVEALHAKGIIHGDLKADNVLVRFEAVSSPTEWASQYQRDGSGGWSAKGLSLIDFGRGIDMRAFRSDVQFIADWKTSEADCAEMREMRPWTYQVDYHGLAGTIHSLLFGKYIETVAEKGGALGAGANKTYRLRESLKRYWQTDIWGNVFDLLLNPLRHVEGEEGSRMPVVKGMRACREKMEEWVEASCERGVGLKGLIRRMEERIGSKKGR
ncbi:hypothetical protein K490DRAFT_39763 [Saccharata proteae CBS 121410]|uniref:Checkpoint protein kinase-like protein n=1 Tax=Saccharata proteae CBS 121410 TaxID=1314787 RepID=A0A9P4M101_9PEZI|nr:hypothetical protein K490DRAFT_39763 [Saccharata proteae CBS 121410]